MKVAILILCSYLVATYGNFGNPEQTRYDDEARREYEERLREHYRRYPDARYPERGYAAPVSTPAPPPIADPVFPCIFLLHSQEGTEGGFPRGALILL
jgi:hypothetical protein